MSLEKLVLEIRSLLVELLERQQVKAYLGVEEFARLAGKAACTCRDWCRRGRIRGEKKKSGRGAYPAWVISREEWLRYQREGLLPVQSTKMQS